MSLYARNPPKAAAKGQAHSRRSVNLWEVADVPSVSSYRLRCPFWASDLASGQWGWRWARSLPAVDFPTPSSTTCLLISQVWGPEAASGLWVPRPAQPSRRFRRAPPSRASRVAARWTVSTRSVSTPSRPQACTTVRPSPSSPTKWPPS